MVGNRPLHAWLSASGSGGWRARGYGVGDSLVFDRARGRVAVRCEEETGGGTGKGVGLAVHCTRGGDEEANTPTLCGWHTCVRINCDQDSAKWPPARLAVGLHGGQTHARLLRWVRGLNHSGRLEVISTTLMQVGSKLEVDADSPTYILTEPRVA